MLIVRAVLAVFMIALGLLILIEMLQSIHAGLAIVPGVVLAAAMIALGTHRLRLILRARRMT